MSFTSVTNLLLACFALNAVGLSQAQAQTVNTQLPPPLPVIPAEVSPGKPTEPLDAASLMAPADPVTLAAPTPPPAALSGKRPNEEKPLELGNYKKIHAIFLTSLGSFKVQLFHFDCPETVKNFIELSLGRKTHFDFQTGNPVRRPFYNGLTFHRVVKGNFIQGGDPAGNGRGSPGFANRLEVNKKFKFDSGGRVAAVVTPDGQSVNGSQFFITIDKADWLDSTPNSIFGQVVAGMETVKKISGVKTNALDRPLTPVKIESVELEFTEWPAPAVPELAAEETESSRAPASTAPITPSAAASP